MTSARIVVVGGANMDIVGHPDAPLVSRDSNPGHVRISPGGVGRNIAENLVRLELDVELVTVFGDDSTGIHLAEMCSHAGISLRYALRADIPESVYLAILDSSGDMAIAINDMRALDLLTPEALAERAGAFVGAALVVVDANLPAESLDWLARRAKAPILLDPVSVAKAPRTASLLRGLAGLKCNVYEAGVLLGREIEGHGPASIARATVELRARGVERVFITAGPAGVWFAGPEGEGSLPAPVVEVLNATGAGDAFTAGVAYALVSGLDTETAGCCGTTLAALALASEQTVSPAVNLSVLGTALDDIVGRNCR